MGTDNCQCTLEQATKEIDLSTITSQPMEQNNPKEIPKGPLWGLQEWDKGVVCATMSTPSPSASPVSVDPEETLCIKQWYKTKSLTISRLDIFTEGVKNVLKIVDENILIPYVSIHKAKEAVTLSLNLYAERYLTANVQATCRTLHPDWKDMEVWVMAQRLLFLKKESAESPLADRTPRCPFRYQFLGGTHHPQAFEDYKNA